MPSKTAIALLVASMAAVALIPASMSIPDRLLALGLAWAMGAVLIYLLR